MRAAWVCLVDHGLSHPLWQQQFGWLIKNLGRHAPAFPSGVAGIAARPAPHLIEGTTSAPLRCSRAPEAIVRTIGGHLLRIAIPKLTTWRQPTKRATKAIEQLEGMHQRLRCWCGMGRSLAKGEHSSQSRLTHAPRHPHYTQDWAGLLRWAKGQAAVNVGCRSDHWLMAWHPCRTLRSINAKSIKTKLK